jgi:tetratricopeptide (TPR) repeat protein
MSAIRITFCWRVRVLAAVSLAALAACTQKNPKPNLVELAFLQGMQAEKRGDLSEAVSKYLQTTALDSTFCSGYFASGNVYERQAKVDEAMASFEKALACFKGESPTSPRVYSESTLKADIQRTTNRIAKLKATVPQTPQ